MFPSVDSVPLTQSTSMTGAGKAEIRTAQPPANLIINPRGWVCCLCIGMELGGSQVMLQVAVATVNQACHAFNQVAI